MRSSSLEAYELGGKEMTCQSGSEIEKVGGYELEERSGSKLEKEIGSQIDDKWKENDRTSMRPRSTSNELGPWFSYMQRPIFPCEENITDIIEQLRESTSFFSNKGPRSTSGFPKARGLLEAYSFSSALERDLPNEVGPPKVPSQTPSLATASGNVTANTSSTSFVSKLDKIIVINCVAKRRRNGERWEYKLTNESRREFLRKLSDLVS